MSETQPVVNGQEGSLDQNTGSRLRKLPAGASRYGSSSPERIYELDGVRAIAILLVIGCHYAAFSRLLWGLPRLGWLGVDIFFVLSGYLITTVLLHLKGTKGAFDIFYTRRGARILPPFYLALALIFTACMLTHDSTIFELGHLFIVALFLQSFSGLSGLLHALGSAHTGFGYVTLRSIPAGMTLPMSNSASILWSLSIEEYFYLVWAPIVLWFSRRAVFGIAAGICVGEFLVRWFGFTSSSNYYSIFYRFDALTYGAIAALTIQKLKPRILWAVLGICGAGLVSVFVGIRHPLTFDIRGSRLFMVFGLPLISAGFAACISLLVVSAGSQAFINRFLRSRPMRQVGTVSYMLYLIHGVVYLSVVYVFASEALPIALLSAFLAIGLSWLSWKYIEAPILSSRLVARSARRYMSQQQDVAQESSR